MADWLTMTIQMVSLVVAVWCLISTFRDQPMLVPHLIGVAVLVLRTQESRRLLERS